MRAMVVRAHWNFLKSSMRVSVLLFAADVVHASQEDHERWRFQTSFWTNFERLQVVFGYAGRSGAECPLFGFSITILSSYPLNRQHFPTARPYIS